MDNFSLFGSVAAQLHDEFVRIFYIALPAFFALAIALDWIRNPTGSPDFVETLKRAFVATLLVAGFQEISEGILALASSVADRISDLSGFDQILQMAGEKCRNYSLSVTSLVLGFNDLMVAILSFASYFILYIARYITVALYHFMWILLTILSPLLMLFHLFRGTQSISINLFRSLCEVASWKIIWAILSAMLTSLSFGNAYAADGNYLTVIVLNFVIALAMLGTPLIVKSLIGSGLAALSETLGMGAAVAIAAAPARVATALSVGREVLTNVGGAAQSMGAKMQPHLPGLTVTTPPGSSRMSGMSASEPPKGQDPAPEQPRKPKNPS